MAPKETKNIELILYRLTDVTNKINKVELAIENMRQENIINIEKQNVNFLHELNKVDEHHTGLVTEIKDNLKEFKKEVRDDYLTAKAFGIYKTAIIATGSTIGLAFLTELVRTVIKTSG